MSPAFEELENDIWPEPDVYAELEAVLAVLVGGSLDRGDDPVVAVAEDAAPEQGEANDAVAGVITPAAKVAPYAESSISRAKSEPFVDCPSCTMESFAGR